MPHHTVLSPRMPDLVTLEVLLAVARTGSLGAAGRELMLSQQAVSARIASLEAQVGVTLLTRSARGSQLTSAGSVAVQWADQLLRLAEEVDTGLAALRAEGRNRALVSASMTVAEQLLPNWLVSLQAEARRRGVPAPQIVLTATNTDHVIEHIASGQADLGFVEGPSAPRGLRSRVVAHDELVVVVPPSHPWARRSAITADELRHTALVMRESGSGTRDSLISALAQAPGAPIGLAAPALELSTTASVRAAVIAGAGPAVLSRLAVSDDIATGRLCAVPVADVNLGRKLRAVWLNGQTPPAGAARDLLAHIGATSLIPNSRRKRAHNANNTPPTNSAPRHPA